MQLYSRLYREAMDCGNVFYESRALHEARRWLRASEVAGHRMTRAIVIRRVLGIPFFERLRARTANN